VRKKCETRNPHPVRLRFNLRQFVIAFRCGLSIDPLHVSGGNHALSELGAYLSFRSGFRTSGLRNWTLFCNHFIAETVSRRHPKLLPLAHHQLPESSGMLFSKRCHFSNGLNDHRFSSTNAINLVHVSPHQRSLITEVNGFLMPQANLEAFCAARTEFHSPCGKCVLI
jgi:hypothetical protein